MCYCRWVPFHIAKPLLDKKPYVVLSDFLRSEKEGVLTCRREDHSAPQPSLISGKEEDVPSDGDEPLKVAFDRADSGADDDSELEASSELVDEMENGDMDDIKIRISNKTLLFKVNTISPFSCLNIGLGQRSCNHETNITSYVWKDLVQASGPSKCIDSLKLQLHKYKSVVGSALSKRMIYLLD